MYGRRALPILPAPVAAVLLGGCVAAVLLGGCDERVPATAPPPVTATTAAAAAASVAQTGQWSAPFSWPIVASHLILLPDGRLLSWQSSDVQGDQANFDVWAWNPATGTFTQ